MKRRLVLTNEGAGHPFRRRLPRPATALIEALPDDRNDLRLFALSFTAFFVAIYSFIA
jgi:hypothetical protein